MTDIKRLMNVSTYFSGNGNNSSWTDHFVCIFWYLSFFPFLSRVSILTRDIDIANLSVHLSVCPSVRDVPVSDENGLT